MSKNIEATGERRRPYDLWREGLAGLPQDTFISLDLENSTSAAGFDIHCLIVPRVLKKTDNLTNEEYAEAVNKLAAEYAVHERWLALLSVPVFPAVIDYPLGTALHKKLTCK